MPGILKSIFSFIFYGFSSNKLERAILDRTPSQRFTHAFITTLRTCPRTCGCRESRPHPLIFLPRTNDPPHTWRFYLPLQTPTFMTTASSSLCTPLILMSLDQFTTGHKLRTSTLSKTRLVWMTSISSRPLIFLSW